MTVSAPVPKLDQLLGYLSVEFDGYSFQEDKDRKYFSRLILEFHDLDIAEELKQFHAWSLDQPESKKIYYRSRFRSWLKTSREFRESRTAQVKAPPPAWLRRRYATPGY